MKSPSTNLIAIAAAVGVALMSFALFEPQRAIVSCILGWVMIAIAAYDAENFIIPDVLSLPMIPAGLIIVWLWDDIDAGRTLVLEHFLAAIAGGILLYAVRYGYYVWRGREGLGLGDVKLAAVAGAWTGLQGMSNALLLACVTAIFCVALVRVRGKSSVTATSAVPFGVFFGPAIWVIWCVNALAARMELTQLAAW
ncbi:prepilin peptidase [Hyphomicrobium facile]|uniref:Leader peptidase (Prepilin peptidase) / N-methyltransferase n=1 Tax=Hyphomicrobium facile TaxID=51670 RepID=A0A1I7NRT0_9HYPH|nr:A24 family peptidase [Hyphomicrobium facile]SFV37374.1 leader peptidase (prepilin peptidase) / N-methyltransferase [Hyphomicrobium facile]